MTKTKCGGHLSPANVEKEGIHMKRMFALVLALSLALSGCASDAASTAAGSVPAETVEATADAAAASPDSSVAADAEFTQQVFAMDTYMELRAYGPAAGEALERITEKIQFLDMIWSVTDEHSEVSLINSGEYEQVAVSADTVALLSKALDLGASTDGALDVTIYPVSRAWGFTTGEYRVPPESELEALLQYVDDSQVELDMENGTVSLPAEAELDLGAVAKGYAGDLTAEMLKEAGVTSALLNLGASTIRTVGVKPDGSNWRIAIQDPNDSGAYAGVVELGEGAVDTSGGYERYFEGEDGQIYWHILDPKTGRPAQSGLVSVTVLSEDAFTGDGLSTALFVMGLEDAVTYWREHGGFEFILIGDDGTIYVSEGAADQFTPLGTYETAELTVIPYEG